MEIKPIETIYNGYHFRSRLEARWAVFFDALGIEWEYEPEGFDLGGGVYYLPDFRVKCYGTRGSKPFMSIDENDLCMKCEFNPTREPYPHECGMCKAGVLKEDDGLLQDREANGITVKCHKFKEYTPSYFDLYIEVKGVMSDLDAYKIKTFANSNSVLIVNNIPNQGTEFENSLCVDMNGITPFNYEFIDGDWFGAYPAADEYGHFYLFGDDSNYFNEEDEDRVEKAYTKARQARFEYRNSYHNK